MNEFSERGEESTEAIFPLKARGPTLIIYVSMFMFARPSECRAALVGLAAVVEGGRDERKVGGGRGGAGPRQPQAASAHIYTQPNHVNCSVNADQQPMEGELLHVSPTALFLIHYMTAL